MITIANRICRAELTDLSAKLVENVGQNLYRLAIVANSPWNLTEQLSTVDDMLLNGIDLTEINNPDIGIFIGTAKEKVKIVGLFPGQGSHFINMGEELKDRYKFISDFYTSSDKSTSDIFAETLSQRIFTNIFRLTGEQLAVFENTLKNTGTAQPAIVMSSLAMFKILEFFGIQPDICVGHSLGEVSAMAASGFFSDETAVKIAALRGKSKTDLNIPDTGAMAAAVANAETVNNILKDFEGEIISVANYNSHRQTVVSGGTRAVERFVNLCKGKGIGCKLLPVSHAFHSDIVGAACEAFEKSLKNIELNHGSQERIKQSQIISTATGNYLQRDAEIIKLLSGHIRKPVRFIEAVEKASESKPDLWIEIGPGGVLCGLVKAIAGNDALCMASNLNGEELFTTLNHLVAQCFVAGVNINADRLFANRFYRDFDIADYHPIFITNPCERKIDYDELELQKTALIGSGLIPEHEGMGQYLEQRRDYIREMIDLDFRHFNHEGAKPEDTPEKEKATPFPEEVDAKNGTNDDYLDFAINWIAKRTGIPKDRLNPDLRLRDDLNLDSIRAGELVIMLSKQMKAEKVITDPSMFANSRIRDIVDQIRQESKSEETFAVTTKNLSEETTETVHAANWVNTFGMEPIEYSIENEKHIPLAPHGKLTLVCNEADFDGADMLRLLKPNNLVTHVVRWDDLENEDVRSASLILVLPSGNTAFFEQSESQFMEQSETRLKKVFMAMKQNLDIGYAFPSGFRCIIVELLNQEDSSNTGYSAFHAFLKTLKLEQKEAYFKMISLSALTEGKNEILVNELEYFGERIRIEYRNGKRNTFVAAPINETGEFALSLSTDDVIIVSGGGKGITFQHALALQKEYAVKLALLGTSPIPDFSSDKESELAANLKLLEKEQISYIYIPCNIADLLSVKNAFAETEKRLGRVSGIFHGAGVSKFNLFKDKSFEEFFECYRVKAFGLYNMLKACQPENLKMLHVISSVLGNTGMRSQCDYTFANAWLDLSVARFRQAHEHIHCLTLGYTVWGETGIGKKLGALDYLKTVGVYSLKIQEGISSYIHLITKLKQQGAFVLTGRLSPDLEANLYAPFDKMKGRFLEHILRFVPQTEIVTECRLSHASDLYLAEHIYNGTPVVPAVMEIEAMVQNVMQCMAKTELPTLRNIRFSAPIIIPKGEQLKIRISATARYMPCETPIFNIAIKTTADQYDKNFIEAECSFDTNVFLPLGLPAFPDLNEPLPINANELSPYPLFQGKLFRRIEEIFIKEYEKDCVTTIRVPENEQYFAEGYDTEIYFGSPVVRDSAYQSGLLIVSPGSLPNIIKEIHYYKKPKAGEKLIFKLSHLVKRNAFEYDFDFVLFNHHKELVAIEKLSLKKPESGALEEMKSAIQAVKMDTVAMQFNSLFPDLRHSYAYVSSKDIAQAMLEEFVSKEEAALLEEEYSEFRLQAMLANLIVARKAAMQFDEAYGGKHLKPGEIQLDHRNDGKPLLKLADSYLKKAIFDGMDISISDTAGYAFAIIAPGRIGIDIEPLAYRDTETWFGLLGKDGYNQARELTEITNENFDISATRVWTLIEAGKKANDLTRMMPVFHSIDKDGNVIFVDNSKESTLHSLIVNSSNVNPILFSLSFCKVTKLSEDKKTIEVKSSPFYIDESRYTRNDFYLTFKDCKSKGGKTFFANFPSWVGYTREIGLYPIGDTLASDLISGKWGLVTNSSRFKIYGEAKVYDKIMVSMCMTDKCKYEEASYLHSYFQFFKEDNGKKSLLATCELGNTWVEIVGHGKVKKAPIPSYLLNYLKIMLNISYTEPRISNNIYLLNKDLGKSIHTLHYIPSPEILLQREVFTTTIDERNAVGNVYFSNYYTWQAKLMDLFIMDYAHKNSTGSIVEEYFSLQCSVEHLQEAMPGEFIEINMYLLELFENGITFFFEYYSNKVDSYDKLAIGRNTIAFGKRNSLDGSLSPLQIPSTLNKLVLHKIDNALIQKK